jgi:ABC-type transporter Mla subunit MlaD
MKLRLVAVITALVALPVLAHAQQGGPPPSNAPKPTKADVQKVVQIITNDKAKTQAYCDLNKLYDQMQTADQKNDSKTVETLGKQADALAGKLGPEYNNMMDGLDQVDPNSSEGKDFASILSKLDDLCSK